MFDSIRIIALLAVATLITSSLHAQQQVLDQNQKEDGPLTKWLECDCCLGDMGGIRSSLSNHGVEFFGGYTAEVWGNTTGGLKQGAVYTGLLDFGANLDFEKMVDWKGASFSTTWLWLSGRDASEDLVGNFLTVSNIAGFSTLRMLEMWFQQDFWQREGDGSLSGLSIRLGQLTADSEFFISDYGATFINGTFGWPAAAYTNIPEGGPGYPMGAPGVRVAITPVEWFTFQTGVYEGNVFAQNVNRHGFRWRLNQKFGALWMNEAQIRWNHAEDAAGLPGQVKLGAWFHSADFAASFGDNTYWGDSGYYGIVDQMLYREPGKEMAAPVTGKDGKSIVTGNSSAVADGKSTKSFKEPVKLEPSNQGLGVFGRISFTPQDRNFVGFYFDTGLVYTGLIPGRDDDVTGIALGFADLTNGAAQTIYDEGSREVGYEAVIEATYDAQITKWLHIQPDLQYIIRPGGAGDLGNALVLGARVAVTF
jgi:porin